MAGPDKKVLESLARDNKIGSMAYMEAERLFKVEEEIGNMTGFPTTDGTYVLTCTVDEGVPALSWVAQE